MDGKDLHTDEIYDKVENLHVKKTGFLERKVVKKPWGSEEVVVVTDKYAMKFLNIDAGEHFSLQYHKEKMETMLVVSGCGKILLDDEEHDLTEGKIVHIMPPSTHRITAVENLRLLEVSTPELWDVVRLEDKYGRT
ncbi:MAG: ectoine synthase [Candidatus Woesearchaeota archaeon]|nr:ectoine synthase [Candidatus Woesearchaeota archaeon]